MHGHSTKMFEYLSDTYLGPLELVFPISHPLNSAHNMHTKSLKNHTPRYDKKKYPNEIILKMYFKYITNRAKRLQSAEVGYKLIDN